MVLKGITMNKNAIAVEIYAELVDALVKIKQRNLNETKREITVLESVKHCDPTSTIQTEINHLNARLKDEREVISDILTELQDKKSDCFKHKVY